MPWIRWRTGVDGHGPEPRLIQNPFGQRVVAVPGQPVEVRPEAARYYLDRYWFEEDCCPACGSGDHLSRVSREAPPTPDEAAPLLRRGVDPWECFRCRCGAMAPLSEVRFRVSWFEPVPEADLVAAGLVEPPPPKPSRKRKSKSRKGEEE